MNALHSALQCFRDAVAATPAGHRRMPGRLSNLAASLEEQFERRGNAADLDEAIGVQKEAVGAAQADGHEALPFYLTRLGDIFGKRFDVAGGKGDLEAAIAAHQQAVTAASPAHPDLPACLGNLGAELRKRFEQSRDAADLDAAISVGTRAAAMKATGKSKRDAILSCLANSLFTRFNEAGDAADLDAAITAGRQALAAAPADRPNAGYLLNLGVYLQARFDRTGRTADLDAAIRLKRQAVAVTPDLHQNLPMYLSNYAASLLIRFKWNDDVTDLNAAVSAGQKAVDRTPSRHPKLPMYLSNHAISLANRYKRTGNSADLDAAINHLLRALELAPPGHPSRHSCLTNYGDDLLSRYRRTADGTDLDAATGAFREAITLVPRHNPAFSLNSSNLGVCLKARFERTGNETDLDDAIRAHREAVDSLADPGNPHLPDRLLKLAACLQTRFERDKSYAHLDAAIACWKRGARVTTAAPVGRLINYVAWGNAAADAGRTGEALEAYTAAVGLLPQVAWHGLDRKTRQSHLAKWPDTTARAAAIAIHSGRPAQAVELLEQGRSILWTQALNLRSDLEELTETLPDLANRLGRIRRRLDIPSTYVGYRQVAGPAVPRTAAERQRDTELRRAKAREWDQVLAKIRGIEGFEQFLGTISYPDLARSPDGPVVMLNTTPHDGSHALIASADSKQPQIVDLPALDRQSAFVQFRGMRDALSGLSDPRRSPKGRARDVDTIFGVLGWLWDVVTDPVLTALGYSGTPQPGSSWPRIWWCPAGPLALLPLHAAGHHPRQGNQVSIDCVMDRVISSYTPTLTALDRARRQDVPGPVRHLSIGVADAAGQLPLKAVPDEMQVLSHHFPPGRRHKQLTGQRATRVAVLAAATDSSWVHFACHALQEDASPDSSGFAVDDGMLTVSDLIAQSTRPRELAFLSACQTATGSTRHPDEASHLAAAMLFLGYRHVIATMWNIGDSEAPGVAEIIYTRLTRDGTPDARHAAEAVHQAVRTLRSSAPDSPQTWAPYLHFGP